MLLFVLFSLTVVSSTLAASNDVGLVDRAVGWRQIVRNEQPLEPNKGEEVISKDDLRTGEGRLQVRFRDDSKLRMTEHTRIVIDNMVFDDDPSKSALAMTFAQGTARFISGQLGKVDKENIRLKTPTASIGIRGTDFTVTVDEFGKTLVVLLPDVNGISSGEIIVSTMTGEVTLNKPFQSTTVDVMENPPSAPAILDLTLDMLNNIMIINPPKEKQSKEDFMDTINASKGISSLDVDFLNEDLLQEEELGKDYLEFNELDINYLDVDLLEDLLDNFDSLGEDVLQEQQSSGDLRIEGTEEGFDPVTQVATIVEGDKVTIRREVNDKVVISVDKSAATVISIEQDGKELEAIKLNGIDNLISIVQ